MTIKDFKKKVAELPESYDNLDLDIPNPNYTFGALEPVYQKVKDVFFSPSEKTLTMIIEED